MPDKAQADIAYGFVGLTRRDPDYYAALVMNNALGQYALGGRLGDSIRERQGMAYYVFSNLEAGLAAGPLMVRAGVSAANVERTIDSIDAELQAVLRQGFSRQEVDDAKLYLIGSLPRQLETNAGIAGFLLSAELHGLGVDHDVRLPGLIRGVTHDDVARVARAPARSGAGGRSPWPGPGRTARHEAPPLRAVFFDVDFTLIHPGPRFQGAGYAEVCTAHGVAVDAALFDAAVTRACRCSTITTTRSTTTGCSSATPRRSSSTWAAGRRA